jgi:hypothetical protein
VVVQWRNGGLGGSQCHQPFLSFPSRRIGSFGISAEFVGPEWGRKRAFTSVAHTHPLRIGPLLYVEVDRAGAALIQPHQAIPSAVAFVSRPSPRAYLRREDEVGASPSASPIEAYTHPLPRVSGDASGFRAPGETWR